MKKQKGQSLIEVVLSVGLIMLVLTGVVSLLISTIGARTKSYDQNKAVELSQIVMEDMVNTKTNDGTNFWNLSSQYWLDFGTSRTNTDFPDYKYSATPVQYTQNGCSNVIVECMNVTVNISWKGNNVDNQFNRFFSRK